MTITMTGITIVITAKHSQIHPWNWTETSFGCTHTKDNKQCHITAVTTVITVVSTNHDSHNKQAPDPAYYGYNSGEHQSPIV